MARLSGWKFPRFALLLPIMAITGVIMYDVYGCGSFKGTKTSLCL